MSNHVPPPPKPPVYKTYAERKAAEDRNRNERNKQTHREYRLPPIPPPGGKFPAPGKQRKSAFDDLGPTRDMEPVKLPLKPRVERDQFADIIPIGRKEDK